MIQKVITAILAIIIIMKVLVITIIVIYLSMRYYPYELSLLSELLQP